MVGDAGFEPAKALPTDLQSAPFGHSGNLPQSRQQQPHAIERKVNPRLTNGAGGRIRTPDLLITNQLLYQLSYTSVFQFYHHVIIANPHRLVKPFYKFCPVAVLISNLYPTLVSVAYFRQIILAS